MRGRQIGGPEPHRQRQLGTVQDRPRRDGSLLAAGGALEGEGLAAVRPAFLVIARGAAKARRPARLHQPSRAGGLVGKSALELEQGPRDIGHGGGSRG